MSLNTTIPRAVQALMDIDERVNQASASFVDDQGANVSVHAWRCGNCDEVHVQIESTRSWNRDEADFDHERPHPAD